MKRTKFDTAHGVRKQVTPTNYDVNYTKSGIWLNIRLGYHIPDSHCSLVIPPSNTVRSVQFGACHFVCTLT